MSYSQLSGAKTLRPVAAATTDRRIDVVGVDQHGDIWQSTQDSANSTTFSPWSQIDGTFRP